MTTDNVREIITRWVFQQLRGYDASSMKLPTNQEVYGKALLIVTKGDGTLAEAERNWVIGNMAAHGAPESVLEMLKTYEATEDVQEVISRDLPIKTVRRAVLYDAIQACSADGVYNEGEKAAIRQLAAKLEISEDEVKQMEDLYQEDKKLLEKKIQVLYAEGMPLASA